MKAQTKKSPAKIGKATPAKVAPKSAAKVKADKPAANGKATPEHNFIKGIKALCKAEPGFATYAFEGVKKSTLGALCVIFQAWCKENGKKPEVLFVGARYEGMEKNKGVIGVTWKGEVAKKSATVKKSRKG